MPILFPGTKIGKFFQSGFVKDATRLVFDSVRVERGRLRYSTAAVFVCMVAPPWCWPLLFMPSRHVPTCRTPPGEGGGNKCKERGSFMIGTGQGETEFSLVACSDPFRCAARSLFHRPK